MRRGAADGIGHVDAGCARIDGCLDHLAQEGAVGAAGVFGAELHLIGVAPGEAHGLLDAAQGLGARDAELGLQVDVGCAQDDVEDRARGRCDGVGRGFDVGGDGPGQGGDLGVPYGSGDGAHGFFVAGRRCGEACFDGVDADGVEALGDGVFLRDGEVYARRLFAVAQGGVENAYVPRGRSARGIDGTERDVHGSVSF